MKPTALFVLLLISGCAGARTEKVTEPSPQPTATVAVVEGTCAQATSVLAALPVDQVRRGRDVPERTRKGMIRVVGVPGIYRSECGAGTALIVVMTKTEIIAAVAGPLATSGNDFWLDEDGEPTKAAIIGRSTDPDLIVLRAPCHHCGSFRTPKYEQQPTDNMTLAGYTDGSDEVLSHPTRTADGAYAFKRIGSVDTWVYSLVPDAAMSGDGIWSSAGGLVGLSYAEEQDIKESSVHRILYVPAGDIVAAARAAISGK